MNVKIIDTRSKWMIREDNEYACRTFCNEFKKCSTRCGYNCRKFGGETIPKIRRWNDGPIKKN